MKEITNRLIILCFTTISAIGMGEIKNVLYICLAGIIYTGFIYFFSDNRASLIFNITLMLIILSNPICQPLIILLCYDITIKVLEKDYKNVIAAFIFTCVFVISIILNIQVFIIIESTYSLVSFIFALLTTVYLGYCEFNYSFIEDELMRIRDDSEEYKQIMIQKNILMRQKQDKDIEVNVI